MLRPYWRSVVLGALCPPCVGLLSLQVTSWIGGALDTLGRLGEGVTFDPTETCLALALAGLAIGVLRFFARHLLIQTSRHFEADLKRDLVAHLQRLPLPYFDQAGTGDLISRLTQDVELVRFMVGPAVLYGASAVVVLPGAAWLMASLSGALAGTILIAFVLMFLSARRLMPRIQAASTQVQEAIGAISDRAVEAFAGIRVLMTFARARAENGRLDALSQHYLERNIALTRLRALYNLLIHVATDVVTLAVLVVGGLEVLGGRLSTGQLFQFLLLLGLMTWPLIALGWILVTLPRAKAALLRIEEIFAQPVEPGAQPHDDASLLPLRGDLEVRGLTFRHAGRDRDALENVSFSLRAGQKLGLVGPMGAGKSTLLALLLRLYEPPRGTIFLDGQDVLDLDARQVRRAFAVAPQDPFLFSDTIDANIRFGAADAIEALERDAAVATAALDQDLPDLRDGIDTIVGERGVTLSGGQKQRVSLARALASDRSVLVLDDTLSAVDHATERRILTQLETARGGRTALVASHRLSAVADADLILVLDDARVVQRGDHASLVAEPGVYRRFHRLQAAAEALEGEA